MPPGRWERASATRHKSGEVDASGTVAADGAENATLELELPREIASPLKRWRSIESKRAALRDESAGVLRELSTEAQLSIRDIAALSGASKSLVSLRLSKSPRTRTSRVSAGMPQRRKTR
jgi:hypothetical protein